MHTRLSDIGLWNVQVHSMDQGKNQLSGTLPDHWDQMQNVSLQLHFQLVPATSKVEHQAGYGPCANGTDASTTCCLCTAFLSFQSA